MKFIWILALLGITSITYAYDYTQTRKLDLESVSGIEALEIDAGAGSLDVKGQSQAQINVTAEIILDELGSLPEEKVQDFLKNNMKLSLETAGKKAKLVAYFENKKTFWGNEVDTAMINLKVAMPKKIALDINDGSGEMKVADLEANVNIDDGSGEINLSNIQANVELDDGSGSINAKNIGGSINIDDGSGSINILHVGGDVDINDGSGSMNISQVEGSVKVNDGSGSINVSDVKKDFILASDGSGGLNIDEIAGKTVIK